MSLSTMHKEASASILVVTLFTGLGASGHPIWAYLSLTADHLFQLKRRIELKDLRPFDIGRHGVVLASGLGQPSEEVKAYMSAHFNFRHDSNARLGKIIGM